jgi:hypothetical protein
MPWFNVDDGFHCHPKVLAAGNAAMGLWARCGSYCARYATNGLVPTEIVRSYGTKSELDRLLKVGWLVAVDGGYIMHDYLDYNRTADQIMADREKAAERKRRQRERDTRDGHDVTSSVTDGVTSGRGLDANPSDNGDDNALIDDESDASDDPVDNTRPPGHGANDGPCHAVSHKPQSNPIQSNTSRITTTHHHPHGADDEDEGCISPVVDHLVNARVLQFPARTNLSAYRARITAQIEADYGEAIRRYLTEHPDYPAELVARRFMLEMK